MLNKNLLKWNMSCVTKIYHLASISKIDIICFFAKMCVVSAKHDFTKLISYSYNMLQK